MKDYYFGRSNEEFMKELDVVTFIRNMRYLKIIMKAIFTTRENKIIKCVN
jgi:hypothetical protein